MKCQKCGSEITDDSKFCKECGVCLINETDNPDSSEVVSSTDETSGGVKNILSGINLSQNQICYIFMAISGLIIYILYKVEATTEYSYDSSIFKDILEIIGFIVALLLLFVGYFGRDRRPLKVRKYYESMEYVKANSVGCEILGGQIAADIENEIIKVFSLDFLTGKGNSYTAIPFEDISGIELYYNYVGDNKKLSVGKALVGGYFFGVAGAVIGANAGKKNKKNTSFENLYLLLYADGFETIALPVVINGNINLMYTGYDDPSLMMQAREMEENINLIIEYFRD